MDDFFKLYKTVHDYDIFKRQLIQFKEDQLHIAHMNWYSLCAYIYLGFMYLNISSPATYIYFLGCFTAGHTGTKYSILKLHS